MKKYLPVIVIIALIVSLVCAHNIITAYTETKECNEDTAIHTEVTEENKCSETTTQNTEEIHTEKESTTQEATTEKPSPKKVTEEIVSEVIYGKWGNGKERKEKLEAAGYDYEEVQKAVTKECPTTSAYTKSKSSGTTSSKSSSSKTTSTGGKTFLGKMKITGYSAQSGFPVGQKTASGVGVNVGQCAMNRSQMYSLGITWGQKIYVEGFGTLTVTDCGCAWGVVDIYFLTNKECYNATSYRNVYLY